MAVPVDLPYVTTQMKYARLVPQHATRWTAELADGRTVEVNFIPATDYSNYTPEHLRLQVWEGNVAERITFPQTVLGVSLLIGAISDLQR